MFLVFALAGCSSFSPKTGIRGAISVDGRRLSNVRVVVGSSITKTNRDGEYHVNPGTGQFTVQVQTIFTDEVFEKTVSVKEDSIKTVDFTFSYADLGLSKIMSVENYSEIDKAMSLYDIMRGYGCEWEYGRTLEYSFGPNIDENTKQVARNFFAEIQTELDNILMFRRRWR
ncbi:MAG: hypothetical protein ACOCP4_04015 [Candidatus Woesearchaeota archaeon]